MHKGLIIIDARFIYYRFFNHPSQGSGRKKIKALSPMGERALIVAIVYCLCQGFFDYFFNLSFRLNTYQLLHNLSIFNE